MPEVHKHTVHHVWHLWVRARTDKQTYLEDPTLKCCCSIADLTGQTHSSTAKIVHNDAKGTQKID